MLNEEIKAILSSHCQDNPLQNLYCRHTYAACSGRQSGSTHRVIDSKAQEGTVDQHRVIDSKGQEGTVDQHIGLLIARLSNNVDF